MKKVRDRALPHCSILVTLTAMMVEMKKARDRALPLKILIRMIDVVHGRKEESPRKGIITYQHPVLQDTLQRRNTKS